MNRTICNTLALYNDQRSNFDYGQWLEFCEKTLDKFHLVPSHIGIQGAGYSENIVTFSKGLHKIKALGLKNIESLSLFVTPHLSMAPAFDWIVFVSSSFDISGQTIIIAFDNSIVGIRSAEMLTILKEVVCLDHFKYGIVYQREFSKGPEYYALGISMGLLPSEKQEEESIGAWLRASMSGKDYLCNHLRGVYPMNIISRCHQKIRIDNMPLHDWIEKDMEKRGSITQIGPELWLWDTTDEEIRNSVYDILKHKNILISI